MPAVIINKKIKIISRFSITFALYFQKISKLIVLETLLKIIPGVQGYYVPEVKIFKKSNNFSQKGHQVPLNDELLDRI